MRASDLRSIVFINQSINLNARAVAFAMAQWHKQAGGLRLSAKLEHAAHQAMIPADHATTQMAHQLPESRSFTPSGGTSVNLSLAASRLCPHLNPT
jgi:hypothetical protein